MKNLLRKIIIILIGTITFFIIYFAFHIPEKVYRYLYPIQYKETIINYSKEFEIDPLLVYSIIKIESNFKADAQSRSGAIGLMQLMENTAKEQAQKLNIEYSKEMLYNPEINLKLGLTYFNSLLDYYNQNYILAFAAYNAGLGNVQKWIEDGTIKKDGSDIENIPFRETNLYVRKIIKTYAVYQKLYS